MAEVCVNVKKMKRKLGGNVEYGELVYEDDDVSIYVVIMMKRGDSAWLSRG